MTCRLGHGTAWASRSHRCVQHIHTDLTVFCCSDVNAEMEDIIEAGRLAKSYKQNQWRVIFSRQYLPQLVINIALPIFNQLDGINSVMFYAPQLFSSLGSGMQMALLMHVIIGVVNVVTTFVAVFTVDRWGRRACTASKCCTQCVCPV